MRVKAKTHVHPCRGFTRVRTRNTLDATREKKQQGKTPDLHGHVAPLTCLVLSHCLTQLTALHTGTAERLEMSRQVIRGERYNEFKGYSRCLEETVKHIQ